MWRSCALVVCLYAAVFATPGDARTYVVRPNECPRPADVTLVITGGDVVAVDLNAGRAVAKDVVVIYDRRFDGWASQRLFSRFVLDPESAQSLAGAPGGRDLEARLCGAGATRAPIEERPDGARFRKLN